MKISRRQAIQSVGTAALAAQMTKAAQVPPAPKESAATPKIAVGMEYGGPMNGDRAAAAQRIKQLGVDHVLGGGPGMLPWTEESLTNVMAPWKAAGVQISNMMINLSSDIIYGKTGDKRDQDIEKIKQSIVAAGKVGLPVVEYNFYAHRAMEGYFLEIDTAAGWFRLDGV